MCNIIQKTEKLAQNKVNKEKYRRILPSVLIRKNTIDKPFQVLILNQSVDFRFGRTLSTGITSASSSHAPAGFR